MDAIDCDVHCAPASFDALQPYLSDYWRQYISEAGIRLTGVAHAYPPGVVPPPPSTYEELASHALDGAAAPRLVVLNCVTGSSLTGTVLLGGIASAINDWMREGCSIATTIAGGPGRLDPVDRGRGRRLSRVGDDPRFVQVLLPCAATCPGGTR